MTRNCEGVFFISLFCLKILHIHLTRYYLRNPGFHNWLSLKKTWQTTYLKQNLTLIKALRPDRSRVKNVRVDTCRKSRLMKNTTACVLFTMFQNHVLVLAGQSLQLGWHYDINPSSVCSVRSLFCVKYECNCFCKCYVLGMVIHRKSITNQFCPSFHTQIQPKRMILFINTMKYLYKFIQWTWTKRRSC